MQQMLRVVLVDFEGTGRHRHDLPFADTVPGFFNYLAEERGLRPATSWPTGTTCPVLKRS